MPGQSADQNITRVRTYFLVFNTTLPNLLKFPAAVALYAVPVILVRLAELIKNGVRMFEWYFRCHQSWNTISAPIWTSTHSLYSIIIRGGSTVVPSVLLISELYRQVPSFLDHRPHKSH